MTLVEKRERIGAYCDQYGPNGACDKCPLVGEPWDHPYNYRGCLVIAQATEAELDRALALFEAREYKPEPVEDDPVNHPTHYTSGGIECLDAIAASMTAPEYEGFLKGQVMKYVWRYHLKGKPVEDLKKAAFYLDRLIQAAEKEEVAV